METDRVGGADVELITRVRRELAAAGDPDRAPQMQKYMKSAMPFHGVRLPEVRRICRTVFDTHPLDTEESLDDTVGQLFTEASFREERYAAIQLAQHRLYRRYQTPARVPLYRTLIVTGAWWDTDRRERRGRRLLHPQGDRLGAAPTRPDRPSVGSGLRRGTRRSAQRTLEARGAQASRTVMHRESRSPPAPRPPAPPGPAD